MNPLIVYSDDDRPSIWFQIINDDGVVDLSDADTVVTWKFRAAETESVLSTGTCTKVKGDGVTGWVQMDWGSTDLDDLDGGSYEIEISISFDGSIQTVNWFYHLNDISDIEETMPVLVKEDF